MSMGETMSVNGGHQRANCLHPDDISMGALVDWYLTGKTEELGEKPVPVTLCLPRIPHGLTQARTRTSAVRSRRAMTRSKPEVILLKKIRSVVCYVNNSK
jgi:hypothetical protein